MGKLYTICCNCGFTFGGSVCGTQKKLYCPKCDAELEYRVDIDSISVRMTGRFANQQKLRIRRYSERCRQTATSSVKQ